jgi:hypothetical protein
LQVERFRHIICYSIALSDLFVEVYCIFQIHSTPVVCAGLVLIGLALSRPVQRQSCTVFRSQGVNSDNYNCHDTGSCNRFSNGPLMDFCRTVCHTYKVPSKDFLYDAFELLAVRFDNAWSFSFMMSLRSVASSLVVETFKKSRDQVRDCWRRSRDQVQDFTLRSRDCDHLRPYGKVSRATMNYKNALCCHFVFKNDKLG